MLHVQDKYGLQLDNNYFEIKVHFNIVAMPNFILPSSKAQLFLPMQLHACTKL